MIEDIILYPRVEEKDSQATMQGMKFEEFRISGHIQTAIGVANSAESLYKKMKSETMNEEYELIELDSDSDIEEDFHAVVESIKYQATKVQAEEIETIRIGSPILPEIQDFPRSKQSLQDKKFLQSLCRLCAFPSSDMIYIFGSSMLHKSMKEKIQRCLPITVKKTDTLSNNICRMCLEKLETCHQFHMSVLRTEKQLLVYHEQTSGKPTEETSIHCQTSSQCNSQRVVIKHEDIEETLTRCSDLDVNNINSNELGHMRKDNEMRDSSCEKQNTEPFMETLNSGRTSAIKNEQDVYYAALNSPISEVHAEEELESDRDVSGSVNQSPTNIERQPKPRLETLVQYPCYFCNETLGTELERKKHWSQHGVVDSETFLQQQIIGVHEQQETSSGNKSGQQFRTNKEANVDGTKKSFKCWVCNQTFASGVLLAKHKKLCLKDRRKFVCDYCKRVLSSRSNLRRHMLTHTEEGRFRCDICPKSFTSKRSKDDHYRLHTGEELYNCDICFKSFTTKRSKIDHYRLHTGEQIYKCDICLKPFTFRQARNHHRKVYHAEHSFICSICGKTFAVHSMLKDHMKYVHSEENRYPCSLCDKSFKRPHSRNIHMINHAVKKMYKCDLCGTQVAWKTALYKHKITCRKKLG